MRMRQSLGQLERAFLEQIEVQDQTAEELQRDVAIRSRKRQLEQTNRAGRVRFWALVIILVAVAVGVTIGMFEMLLWAMG